MEHRRLHILFAVIAIFALGVIIWYFLFSTPKQAPTLDQPSNPFSITTLPARLGFIFSGNSPAPTSTTTTEVTDPTKEPFVRVWDKPATGNLFVTRPVLKEVMATTTVGTSTVLASKTIRATSTVLLFVDRLTGYVYGYNIESGASYQISNTAIPGVHDAYLFNNGTKVIMRYLDTDQKTIKSVMASIPQVSEGQDAQPLVGVVSLPNNITSLAINGSRTQVSYIVPNDNGSSVYTITPKGAAPVASSPFAEWTLSYGGDKLYATTKASAYIEGMTVLLPSYTQALSGKTGLASLPHEDGTILHSMWSSSGLSTFSSSGGTIVSFTAKTLASKCAPGVKTYFLCGVPKTLPTATEGLPDDWYQGRVSFEDDLEMLDAKTGTSYVVYSFDQNPYGPMDITSLATTQKGDLISFIRKQDGELFLLNTNLLNGD